MTATPTLDYLLIGLGWLHSASRPEAALRRNRPGWAQKPGLFREGSEESRADHGERREICRFSQTAGPFVEAQSSDPNHGPFSRFLLTEVGSPTQPVSSTVLQSEIPGMRKEEQSTAASGKL